MADLYYQCQAKNSGTRIKFKNTMTLFHATYAQESEVTE